MNFSENTGFENSYAEIDYKKVLSKYLFFWKYFIFSVAFLVIISFLFIRYSNKIYETTTKIKIIDKKETSIKMPTADELFSNYKINLENEIEVIKSYPLLEEVVKSLNLQVSVYRVGNLMKSITLDYPFDIKLKPTSKKIKDELLYELKITKNGFVIIDLQNKDVKSFFDGSSTKFKKHNFPFEINGLNKLGIEVENKTSFLIKITSVKNKVNYLKGNINVSQLGRSSDIIEISIKTTNSEYAKKVLNKLVNVFDKDGIKDRQLIHKRTIDFVNARYSKLSTELDSIEISKQLYKSKNKLVDLPTNSIFSLEKTLQSEEEIFLIENQISVTNILLEELKVAKHELLPSNIGIENSEINILIEKYNESIIKRNNLSLSAGSKNPSFVQLESLITDLKSNIIFSLEGHLTKLNNVKGNLSEKLTKLDKKVVDLPEKEKNLRAIERNQAVKESLFLFLLTKREEAEVSLAVTEPSIKVVERAISNDNVVYPKNKFIYALAIFLGILVPFIILFLIFYFDNKIYSKKQLEDLKIPLSLLGEIPEIDKKSKKLIQSPKERSALAESFRILVSNLRFFTKKQKGLVIFTTSSVKGEGKTFTALNLSLASASVGKKVLLIGADLHNPQIHNYLNLSKKTEGLSSLLANNSLEWKKTIISSKSEIDCDFILSGGIPPNPAQLLNNGVLKTLLSDVKNYYDYIIVDTPPCVPVSDTLSISHLADIILYVMRCNFTKTEIAEYIKGSFEKGAIKNNSLVVLNGLGSKSKFGYSERYNYGYGYGYSAD